MKSVDFRMQYIYVHLLNLTQENKSHLTFIKEFVAYVRILVRLVIMCWPGSKQRSITEERGVSKLENMLEPKVALESLEKQMFNMFFMNLSF